MGSDFSTLLEATLAHLSELQARGVQFIDVHPESLKALAQPHRRAGAPQPPSPATSRASQSPSPPPSFRNQASSPRPVLAAAPAPALTPAPAVPSAPFPPPLPREARIAALDLLRAEALACQKCPHLAQVRTQVVFGVGNPEASLLFVGEAPGQDEDRQGEPFVGRAGQLLTRIIQAMGLSRETVYIANILKCRPDMPPGSRGNRPPRPEEMDTCKPYLLRQIEIIQPRAIVALGGTAVQGLLGLKTTMGAVRGRWQDFRGIPVMPTFHPSYLLRCEDGPDRGHGEKRKTWEDMLVVLERLQLPISEKMRGYFLKPPTGGDAG